MEWLVGVVLIILVGLVLLGFTGRVSCNSKRIKELEEKIG